MRNERCTEPLPQGQAKGPDADVDRDVTREFVRRQAEVVQPAWHGVSGVVADQQETVIPVGRGENLERFGIDLGPAPVIACKCRYFEGSMPTVSVNHLTRYRYSSPVSFGEHRIMARPRESYDQRLLSAELEIFPEPDSVRWLQDVFGNAVAIASFSSRSDELTVRSTSEVEHLPTGADDITVENYAQNFPFTYSSRDMPDLLRSIERDYRDPSRSIDEWARSFLDGDGSTPTLELLKRMTKRIKSDFAYRARYEEGIQAPLETLSMKSGTCRDYAILMMEAVRSIGLAARFVSGYLYDYDGRGSRVGGHSTHAWVRIYLPGSGWIEFDPTNGIIGNNGLIRVAVARDPAQAKPLSGTWRGVRGSQIDMDVDVQIKRTGLSTPHAGSGQKTVESC